MTLEDGTHRSEGVQHATEEEQRTSSSRANEVVGPNPKGCSDVDAPGSEMKSPMLQRKILHSNLECKIYEPW